MERNGCMRDSSSGPVYIAHDCDNNIKFYIHYTVNHLFGHWLLSSLYIFGPVDLLREENRSGN